MKDFQYKIITENLPYFPDIHALYLDVETRNQTEVTFKNAQGKEQRVLDKKYSGLYPFPVERAGKIYRDDICGFAFAIDDDPIIYYVPLRHRNGQNCNIEEAQRWLTYHLNLCKEWRNHNLTRFDAPFMAMEGIIFTCDLVDTLTLSKVHYSDRLGHGLKVLCREWCKIPMSEELEIKTFLKEAKTKDYSRIPIDMLGKYACEDVFGNRKLYEYILTKRPKELEKIWKTEIQLASILFDMQMRGLRVDRTELLLSGRAAMIEMIAAAEIIENLNFDQPFVDSAKCIHDMLHVQRDLPVLVRKKPTLVQLEKNLDGSATYDKAALEIYLMHPNAPKELLQALLKYRENQQHKSLYVDAMLELMDKDSRIHPSYNAVVRTGRMSGSQPNIMQQNYKSKLLIHPDHGFVAADFSQIEFRLIVHYIEDYEAIAAYNADPLTDFHQWVADLVNISRKLAKTLNFAMAYGAGKAKVISQLAASEDVRNEIGPLIDSLISEGRLQEEERKSYFGVACEEKGEQLYEKYHDRLSGIKATAEVATITCKKRGWVQSLSGRRRQIDSRFAYKAFNTVIQSFAAELMKERMIAISPRYNSDAKKWNVELAINVHDELVIDTPNWDNPECHKWYQDLLETHDYDLSIPLKVDFGFSDENWAEAKPT